MNLKNKVALITGACTGIGRQIAKTFAQAGASVGVADLNIETARQTVSRIKNQNGQATAIAMDVTDVEQVSHGWSMA